MKLARPYALVGAAAGLLLGTAAALGATAVALGASWIFLFGDEPWPDAVGPVILGLGALIGLLVLSLCVWAGHRFGKRCERAPAESRRIARRRAHVLLGICGATVLALIVGAAAASLRSDAEREADAARERSFADLVRQRHGIRRVEVRADPRTLRIATVHLHGRREGD